MSTPFYAREFAFTQPDGQLIHVRGWGNQSHAVFETLDGFTLVKDPATGFYQYATLSDDAEALVPTGAQPGMFSPSRLGLAPGLRTTRAAAKFASMSSGLPRSPSRWEVRRDEARVISQARALAAGAGVPLPAPPRRTTTGDYVGLCLLVQFPDIPGTLTPADVEAFCNQSGYRAFGNNGSVKDYFHEVSAGKLRYSNIVTAYYTARHPRAYYTNRHVPQPQRAVELIKEALTDLKSRGFDFRALTADSQDYVYALNVFYAGARVNNWAEGLWPHAYHLPVPFPLGPGKNAFDYQITNMGHELTLGTFCHENGHMICDFPDLYDYGPESRGVGSYCLMCAGGNVDAKNPTHPGAYLKYRAGWATKLTRVAPGQTLTLEAGRNEFALHERAPTEYFILENRLQSGRDIALPGSGLAIWHIDELGNNSSEHMTPASHYECSLVQADSRFDLERGLNDGDADDLFRAGGNDEFSSTSTPHSHWWDRTASGLAIRAISPPGPTMQFSS